MSVSYGTYNFSSPLPFAAFGETPVYIGGKIDHFVSKINLIGKFTGENLHFLSNKKTALKIALSEQYQTLTVDTGTFDYAKPIGISFGESDMTTVLPYSIEFETYNSGFFSQYYGVKDPQNSWEYVEQQGRIVGASHAVSAVGVKTNADDPLDNAKSFVNAHLAGFENISLFNTGNNAFLRTKTEEIDQFRNSYGVTEQYVFSKSPEPITNSGVVSANTKISYTKEGGLQLSVEGSIIGSITGAKMTTGLFSPTDAQNLAINAVERSKSAFESGVYGFINRGPLTYNYDVNETSNAINFSFQFKDPTDIRSQEVINTYTASVNASRDSSNITVSVNGELKYNAPFDLFGGEDMDQAPRFLKLQAAWADVKPFNIASEHYSDFLDVATDYESSKYLNPDALDESVVKDPFTPMISYSYQYGNTPDYSDGLLDNFTMSISDNLSIDKAGLKEMANGGFNSSSILTIGEFSINSSCLCPPASTDTYLDALKAITKVYLRKGCVTSSESSTVNKNSISYSITSIY